MKYDLRGLVITNQDLNENVETMVLKITLENIINFILHVQVDNVNKF